MLYYRLTDTGFCYLSLSGFVSMFSKVDVSKKDTFLDKAKVAREQRATGKWKEKSVVKIQALVRRFLARRRIQKQIRGEVDEFLQIPNDPESDYKPELKPGMFCCRTICFLVTTFYLRRLCSLCTIHVLEISM